MKPSLNSEQQAAVDFPSGPLLVVAGAGSGKTTVIVERIKKLLLERKVKPSEILALTFTEKAASEMEARIDEALPYGYSELWLLTFHAFCDRILKQEALHLGLNPSFRLMTEAEAMLYLKRKLYTFKLNYFRPLGNPYKFLSGLLTHFSRLKDEDITPAAYTEYAKSLSKRSDLTADEIEQTQELALAFTQYEKLKAEDSVMDFSDLIANTLRLFRSRPSILKKYQNQFKFILVDEFQDTNYAQNELAMLLTNKDQNITVVGDDDQAIYRFRGAALANISQFRTHFPTAKVITLNKNYRSTEAILKSSHQMIQHNNPDRLEISENINKQLKSMRQLKGEAVEFLYANHAEDEADTVIAVIKKEIDKHNYTYNDFAILVRANDHAQPFMRAMDRAGIPYQFLGPGKLFHKEEIKDLIAYLRILADLNDSQSLYRVLTMPIFTIPPRDIASLLTYAKKKNLSLYEALEQAGDTFINEQSQDKITRFLTMFKDHLTKLPRESSGQILYAFLHDSGQLNSFLSPSTIMDDVASQNIAKFFDKIKNYEATHDDISVFALLDWIELAMQLGESPLAADIDYSDTNAVNILTVHSSKGLEFPVVFVVNLVSQRFPSRDRRDQIPLPAELVHEKDTGQNLNLSEERRLFYVAMTRARNKLYLSAAKYYGEGKRERKLSPFPAEALGQEEISKAITLPTVLENKQLSLLYPEQITPLAKTETNFTPISYLSYSQIQTYEMCPLHYKLRYLLNIPTFPSPSLSYGVNVHAILREYYALQISGNQPNITAIINNLWSPEGYISREHAEIAKKQAEKVTKNYTAKNNPQILTLETPFTFILNKLKIGGRIDRIDLLDNNCIEIIDYKTGKNMPNDKKLVSDLQLTIYALAATLIHDKPFNKTPDEIKLSLHYVEQDKVFSTTRTVEELQEARVQLLGKAEEISRSNFACSITNCQNCEYKMLCHTSKA